MSTLVVSYGVSAVLLAGCTAEPSATNAPSWQHEVQALDAGAVDGSRLLQDVAAQQGVSLTALPEAGERAQQQRTGQTTRWFAPYDNQVLVQRADGAFRRSFDDGAHFHDLPSGSDDAVPGRLLHGGFASDGSFWGVEADAAWHHDGDMWHRYERDAEFAPAGALAMIAPDPASNAVIVVSTDGQLWSRSALGETWRALKSDAAADGVRYGEHPGERFEFDAAIAGRVWHTQGADAWYADLDETGVVRWARDARPVEVRADLPMRAPEDAHWL